MPRYSENDVPQTSEPLANGVLATAKQSWHDLFVWKQRVVVTNKRGVQYTEWRNPDPIENPIRLIAQLSARDWLFFLVGFLAWTGDAFDFHSLSIQTVKLAKYYNTSKTNITTAITLTLLLRSVGAGLFGLAGDKWGRKWPMVTNMLVLGILQIGTIFSPTLPIFLAVRSLFGLFMGGIYGNAIAMALEHCPSAARGLMSGILQQGYAVGYIIAAILNLRVGGGNDSWKIIFWAAAGLSIGVGLVRILFPESKQFLEARAAGKKASSPAAFWRDLKRMLKLEWKICLYCILLMTWFNYFAHTSQDSFTTFMLTQKELDNSSASRVSIIMITGAIVGGTIIGYVSQFFGRRRAVIFASFMAGVLIPAWILPNGEAALSVGAFFLQFFIQGAWGVVPIHLNELSPAAFRSSFPGVTYQIGNMLSSPAAQIVNAIAEQIYVTRKNGDRVEAYGPVMAIATAIVATLIIITTALGPEKQGRAFEHAIAGVQDEHKRSFEASTDEEKVSSGEKLNNKAANMA